LNETIEVVGIGICVEDIAVAVNETIVRPQADFEIALYGSLLF
jgi:hypothetical protein